MKSSEMRFLAKFHKTITFDLATINLIYEYITVTKKLPVEGNFSAAVNYLVLQAFSLEKKYKNCAEELSWRRKATTNDNTTTE